ncbi:MAG TPA: hypothetical protein VG125_03970 [Pirellulales bacterium]|jgi:hypothetical protein|nr:hypothetical protein [Pirellulales bacterium]
MENDAGKTERIKREMDAERRRIHAERNDALALEHTAREQRQKGRELVKNFMQVEAPAIMGPYAAARDCTAPSTRETGAGFQCDYIVRYPLTPLHASVVIELESSVAEDSVRFALTAKDGGEDRKFFTEKLPPRFLESPIEGVGEWLDKSLAKCMTALVNWEERRPSR